MMRSLYFVVECLCISVELFLLRMMVRDVMIALKIIAASYLVVVVVGGRCCEE